MREMFLRSRMLLFLIALTGCSSLKERIGNNLIKSDIESCKQTIKETRPDFSLVECDDSQASCQERIRRMAPSVDCTYHLEPCKQAARKGMLSEWRNQIPESCHELKKKYPRAFNVPEGEMP